jgi:hypothetical protein
MLCTMVLLLGGPAWVAVAQPAGEKPITGWQATGPAVAPGLAEDAPSWSYTAAAGAPLVMTASEIDARGAQSLAFRLNSSGQLPIAVRIAEKDGSVYQLFVTCLPNQLCDVLAPLTDAQLEDGSSDENGALDADQVATVTLQTLANMPGEMADLFGTLAGPQTLAIAQAAFRSQAAPSRSRTEEGKIVADSFDEPALYVLPVGGAELAHVPGAQGGQPSAVRVRFPFAASGPRAWPGIVVPVGQLDLSAARSVRLRLRAPGPLRFHVLAEEQDGSRYEGQGELPEGGAWAARDLRLSEFKLDPTRQDQNGALDPDELRVVVVIADSFNVLLDDQGRSEFAVDDVIFLP